MPLFDATLAKVQAEIDAEIAKGIDTPIPKDFSGGYTHVQHKRNFVAAQQAGVLYQILQDEKYAKYVRDMLFQYEEMYLDLPLHPQERSYARGKLFWQSLNDSNWLVYMSQAYDTIFNYLSEEERSVLEKNLFRPFADFISLENPAFYNRVHNHSTWGNAAVGMIGLVMDDEDLIQRALYGIEDDGLEIGGIDNDGGTIKTADQRKGFLANLEEPFSPDGYYTEGPYYQRYAMYPFLIFSLGMHNAKPELAILEHKDGVLLKAIDALLDLTDADGEFFPLNDGQKGMSYFTSSLVTAVNVGHHYGEQNPQLLSIAEKQNEVLQDYGLARFVNIGQKGGGNYLKENKTWAKTTIAHNTLSQNQEMHFKGSYAEGSKHHSELHFYDASKEDVQVVSAREENAYPGTHMQRSFAMIKDENFENAFLVDILKVKSKTQNQYDLPFYFMGQVIDMNFDYQSPEHLVPLGKKNGYQHLYLEAKGKPASNNTKLSWLGDSSYYTLTSATNISDELMFTRIGAKDPEFNLHREAGFMIRRNDASDTLFVSVIEAHGGYSPVSESSINSSSNIANVKVLYDSDAYTALSITDLQDATQVFILANENADKSAAHTLTINDEEYSWTGPYFYK